MRTLGATMACLLAAATARAQPCVVDGADVTLVGVPVEPAPDEPGFVVDVAAERVRMRAAGGSKARIAVEGALAFEADVGADRLPLGLVREVSLADGVVRMPAGRLGWSVRRLRDARGGLRVWLANDGVTMAVQTPCDAWELGATPSRAARRTSAPIGSSTGRRWRVATARVAVRPAPYATPGVTLHLDPGTELVFAELERRGPWIRGRHVFGDGTVIDGWLRREPLEPNAPGLGWFGRVGGRRTYWRCGRPASADVFEGPAVVDVG
ncbi:MAG TPA: hypothetical protein RMH99_11625, partial [Sandaracinaceae bacterium LLY-WYZ-13_1]|nr:hypothetical protein [Sandaracinaceae bacterium LLY-WYZ-13_1]